MTPLPGAVQSTGLILATVLAAAGLNLGVMSLGQDDGDGTEVETAATPTSTDAGLQALNDTAPAAVGSDAVAPAAPADSTATDPALTGSTLAAGTSLTPGPPVAAGASSTPTPAAPGTAASSTAAASTATPSTAAASTATSQPTTVPSRPTSTQVPSTVPPATVTTARPTTVTTARPTTTTSQPTTSSTRPPQTANYDHAVTGAGALTVSVADGARLGLVSVSDASGWTHTVDTNRADLVRVVFTRRGNEIAVSVTLRNGVPNFTEERSNDD